MKKQFYALFLIIGVQSATMLLTHLTKSGMGWGLLPSRYNDLTGHPRGLK